MSTGFELWSVTINYFDFVNFDMQGIPGLHEISFSANKVPKCLQHKMEAKMMDQSGAPEYFEISLPP